MATGFYLHRPSGEHRVLCTYSVPMHHATPGSVISIEEAMAMAGNFHYVLSTGAGAEARQLGRIAHHTFTSACVTLGATLYWLHHPEAGGGGGSSADMVAFDTVSETFRRLPRPPPPSPGSSNLRAFDMDGRLAVSVVEKLSRRMDVWVLHDEGEGSCWSCILRIDELPPLRYYNGGFYQSYEAVGVLEGGELVVVGGGWVVVYDVKGKRELSRVDHRGRVLNLSMWLYRESLVKLPEPDPRPCPISLPGGEPLLHYYSSSDDDDDADVHLYGNRISGRWIVSDNK